MSDFLNKSIKTSLDDAIQKKATATFAERNKGANEQNAVLTACFHVATGILSIAAIYKILSGDITQTAILLAVCCFLLVLLEWSQHNSLDTVWSNTLHPTENEETDLYLKQLVGKAMFLAWLPTIVNIALPVVSGYFSFEGTTLNVTDELNRLKSDKTADATAASIATVKSKYKGAALKNLASAKATTARTDSTSRAAIITGAQQSAADTQQKRMIAAAIMLVLALFFEFGKWNGAKSKWLYIYRAYHDDSQTQQQQQQQGGLNNYGTLYQNPSPTHNKSNIGFGTNWYKDTPSDHRPTSSDQDIDKIRLLVNDYYTAWKQANAAVGKLNNPHTDVYKAHLSEKQKYDNMLAELGFKVIKDTRGHFILQEVGEDANHA